MKEGRLAAQFGQPLSLWMVDHGSLSFSSLLLLLLLLIIRLGPLLNHAPIFPNICYSVISFFRASQRDVQPSPTSQLFPPSLDLDGVRCVGAPIRSQEYINFARYGCQIL